MFYVVSIPKGEATNLLLTSKLILYPNVSIPKGEATNQCLKEKFTIFYLCFNPQRGGYKLLLLIMQLNEEVMFQSPKGRLQTFSNRATAIDANTFQSPKGRLQTSNGWKEFLQTVKFQSPKGRLQTCVIQAYINFICTFQSPKGRLQTFKTRLNQITMLISFNPQRGGYKHCPTMVPWTFEKVSIPKGEATN